MNRVIRVCVCVCVCACACACACATVHVRVQLCMYMCVRTCMYIYTYIYIYSIYTDVYIWLVLFLISIIWLILHCSTASVFCCLPFCHSISLDNMLPLSMSTGQILVSFCDTDLQNCSYNLHIDW